MAKKVVFIVDSPSIFVNSMTEGIRAEGLECEVLLLEKLTADSVIQDNTMDVLWLYDDLMTNFDIMLFLRNLYVRNKRKMFLFGYMNQIELVSDFLPESVIADVFERPMNAPEMAEQLIRYSRINPSKRSGGDPFAKKHILVVDDSGPMLRTIKGWLEPRYTVSIVNSATNAISFLSSHHPDLILLDYEMPVCPGPMLLQMIRAEEETRDIPVFFLTGKDDRESVETAIHLSPEGYLLKTMKPAAIIGRIDQFFNGPDSSAF